MFQDALLVALPVTILDVGALVVFFLAFGESDFQLGTAFFPVQGGGGQRVALAFHGADHAVDFIAVQQQWRQWVVGDGRLVAGYITHY